MDLSIGIQRLAVAFVPLAFGIIAHEVAHAWVAKACGDPTASRLGRITLNPLPHIDPMGLFVFVVTSLTGPFIFGWAKPVPINPQYFRHLNRDTIFVSAAGPLTNFLLAVFFGLLLRLQIQFFPPQEWLQDGVWQFFRLMFYAGVTINLTLAWLNLMPIPPLDGSKILWGLLPPAIAWRYMQLERYGMILILLLILTGGLGLILRPLIGMSEAAVFFLVTLF